MIQITNLKFQFVWMADFIPVESSDVKNVIFMFLVIFRRKRPRFASFFIRQPRQKSNPRLIRSFPFFDWLNGVIYLPDGLKLKVRDKLNTLDRRCNTRSYTLWARIRYKIFRESHESFSLFAKRRRMSNSRLSQILLYALSAWNHRQEPTACVLNYYYYCYH